MRKLNVFTGFNNWFPQSLLLLGLLLLLQSALTVTGFGARINVLDSTYDAGIVKSGDAINHSFYLLNMSIPPVEVTAQPACGCTVVNYSKQALTSFHRMRLVARVQTDGMSSGDHEKDILLRFRSGNHQWQEVVHVKFHLQ